jgi:Mce-associated membrane protein
VSTDRTVPTGRAVTGRHRAATRTARIALVAGRRLRPAATAPPVDAPAIPDAEGTSDAAAPQARAAAATVAASDNADAAGSEGSAAPASTRRPSRRVVTAVLGVLAVLLGTLTVVLAASARQAATRADAAREVLGPAKSAAARILSYDYRHVQRDADAATAQLTGEFRTQYQTAMRQQIIPQAPKQRAVVQAEVLSAGVSSVNGTGTQAVVIVFANQTVTNSSLTQPRVDQVRVRLTLDKQNGRWLVAKVDAL